MYGGKAFYSLFSEIVYSAVFMTKRIQTYQDLLDEKARLQALLKHQKEIVRQDIDMIKEELSPVSTAISTVGKFFTKDHSNFLVNAGAGALIDIFVKNVLLSKAGWITKRVIPFLLKNFSSHVISGNKDAILKKVFTWLGKKHAHNGQETTEA